MKGFSLSALVAAVRGDAAPNGRKDRLAPVAVPGSERPRMRQAARFPQSIDIVPVLMWISGADTRFTYFNKCWLDFSGRPAEAERGHGWIEGIHPDDRQSYQSAYNEAFSTRRQFQAEFRLKSADGRYRWLLNVGNPMHDESGSFTGYIGTCIDITERKMAEQAVATVSGRLIEAQEQERSRLARELHDDINQRLALLAIELEQLRLNPPAAKSVLAKRIDDLQQTTLDISKDVQALSHELHSSKLDFLGLVPAFSSFCREFSQQKNVAVHFTHANVPISVPSDVSLCLFRVLQEASHNVLKHSGVSRFDVELRGVANHAYLTIRDTGKGFDASAAVGGRGLGLVSMRERLHLVGGTLSIKSGSTRGTEILADVPLPRGVAVSAG
jgi:PAS domain S-box-containing protein